MVVGYYYEYMFFYKKFVYVDMVVLIYMLYDYDWVLVGLVVSVV